MEAKYYTVVIVGGVEPVKYGPYSSEVEREKTMPDICSDLRTDYDTIFHMNIKNNEPSFLCLTEDTIEEFRSTGQEKN